MKLRRLLWLPALLGLPHCGASHRDWGGAGSGGELSVEVAPTPAEKPAAPANGSTGPSANCRLVEQCCPRLVGNDRDACDGIALVQDDLGCSALLSIHPECSSAKIGAATSEGGAWSDGGSGSGVDSMAGAMTGGAENGTKGGVGSSGATGISGGASNGGASNGGASNGGASNGGGGGTGPTGGSSNGDGASGTPPGTVGGGGSSSNVLRNYTCGYAMAGITGKPCENGRTTRLVRAKDLTAAIDACLQARPADREYFCCVLDADGTAPTDATECEAAAPLGPSKLAPAWRPARSCCRFEGETTCPPL